MQSTLKRKLDEALEEERLKHRKTLKRKLDEALEEERLKHRKDIQTIESQRDDAQKTLRSEVFRSFSTLPFFGFNTAPCELEVPKDSVKYRMMKEFFMKSLKSHRPGPGEPHCQVPKLDISRIVRIMNHSHQETYLQYLRKLQNTSLPDFKEVTVNLNPALVGADSGAIRVFSVNGRNCNEFLLFHGLPSDLIDRVKALGFDPRFAGTHMGKLFGNGIYLALNASKSDIYTTPNRNGERCILVVRAALGEPFFATWQMQQAKMPPDGMASVVAKTITDNPKGCVEYPEVVVYRSDATLIEYVIWYKHLNDCNCTHCYKRT